MSPSSPCLCQICGNEFPLESQSGFYEKLTEWLDNHPTFTWSYFNQKATAATLDPWTEVETAHAKFREPFSSSDKISDQNASPSPCASLPVSMRKISSHDFDFPEQLPILSASADGKPTFMPTDFRRENLISMDSILPPRSSLSRDCAALPNERELINELVIDVCRELDITALCFKILQNVCTLVEADRGSLFLVDRNRSTGKSVLVSKLFDVTPECSLTESLSRSEQRRVTIPLGVGVSGHVAQTGEYANIPDAYADPRFTDAVDRETGYKTKCILCMPIKDVDGTVIAVALVMNKRQRRRSSLTTISAYSPTKPDVSSAEATGDLESFTDRDVRVFQSYVNFCGIGLHNAQIYQKSRLETYRNQILLELARIIFSEHSDISRLIYTVLLHTVSLLQCQRCQLLLVKEDNSLADEPESPSSATFSHVFNMTWSDRLDTIDLSNPTHSVENSRFPVHLELASHVVKTGESINLSNAQSDPRFDVTLEADLELPWRTQALLCMPIKHWDGHVLAVCCLVNKGSKESKDSQQIGLSSASSDDDSVETQDATPDWSDTFGQVDECLFEALALFAGLGIANRQTYDRVLRLVAKQRILLDVLSYHATAPISEAKWLANSLIPSVRFFQLDQFTFTDIELSDEITLQATLRMFLEMRFMKAFKIEMLRLCRWILSVKKNYREVTYHNWRHAFNVTQTMFAVLMNANLQNLFSDLECLALLVACLSHDLDHRGTDNQFQVKTMSPLAQLYSTSVLEHHHFNQCMMLLSRKGTDFLSCLTSTDYQHVIGLIREDILATDLSRYFARLPTFQKTLTERANRIAESPSSPVTMEPWVSDVSERSLLGCMLMTTCDISAITKPWPVQKMTAELVTAEFFEQGDLEKSELHTQPRDLMDRNRLSELPNLQLNFIDSVCLPIYKAIVQVSDALQPLLDGCVRNRVCWSHLMEGREVPESLFGIPDVYPAGTLTTRPISIIRLPHATRLGTMNSTRVRQIVSSRPLESAPARRISSVASTTVGGGLVDSTVPTDPPSCTK